MPSKRRSSTWRGEDAHSEHTSSNNVQKMFPNDLCGFRKLESTKVQNEEISKSLTSKEVGLQLTQQQLDEKTYECSVLSRQLQSTLDDARRQVEMLTDAMLTVGPSGITGVCSPLQVEDNMQKVLTKERTSQSKTLDLQSQLSRAKAEQSQLQRSKEEVDH